MMGWEWRLIQEECTGCGVCVDVCAHGAIEMTREMACPEAVPAQCVGCMLCAEQCPVEAIQVYEVSAASDK